MAKKKKQKQDALLSSLAEIKLSSDEDLPREPTPPPAPAPKTSPAPQTSLLDSLLDEVKAEAEREVQEITKTLEEKTAAERRMAEDEEQRKKEQYDKLIQDEARRRLQMIKRKEDEKRQKALELEAREARRVEGLRVQAQQKKTRKSLMVALGVVGVSLAAVVALVLTGVIPLLEEKQPPSATPEEVATQQSQKLVPKRKKVVEPDGPVVAEAPQEPTEFGVDGPGSVVLDLPERSDPGRFAPRTVPVPATAKVTVKEEELRTQLARAFARSTSSSGGSSSSGSSSDGGIKIDDSIFKD
jgi:hypothetical protein